MISLSDLPHHSCIWSVDDGWTWGLQSHWPLKTSTESGLFRHFLCIFRKFLFVGKKLDTHSVWNFVYYKFVIKTNYATGLLYIWRSVHLFTEPDRPVYTLHNPARQESTEGCTHPAARSPAGVLSKVIPRGPSDRLKSERPSSWDAPAGDKFWTLRNEVWPGISNGSLQEESTFSTHLWWTLHESPAIMHRFHPCPSSMPTQTTDATIFVFRVVSDFFT